VTKMEALGKADVQDWLDRYVDAWKSYDPQAIGNLFTEAASYRYHPWDDPITGREAIVANWLESPDAPGSWSARYEPFAVDGDRAVATGWTDYFGEDGTTVVRRYYNVWLMRFDGDGRCVEFVEVFMGAPVEKG
jgi:ketosteroid isomerase-like protein